MFTAKRLLQPVPALCHQTHLPSVKCAHSNDDDAVDDCSEALRPTLFVATLCWVEQNEKKKKKMGPTMEESSWMQWTEFSANWQVSPKSLGHK